jgi:hypothetical protein
MDALYVIAVMTSLNCGVEVLCLRAVEPDSNGEHAQTYSTMDNCIAARDRLLVLRMLHTHWICGAHSRTRLSPTSKNELDTVQRVKRPTRVHLVTLYDGA